MADKATASALEVGNKVKFVDTDDAGSYEHIGVVTQIDLGTNTFNLDVPSVGVLTLDLVDTKFEVLEQEPAEATTKRVYKRSEKGRKLDMVFEILATRPDLKGKQLLIHVMEVADTTLSGANSFVYQARKQLKLKEQATQAAE